MPSKIQKLLEGKNDRIDYREVVERYPWIVSRGQNCILSPDSDGLLCGLFMSHFLGWKIRGFYDTKVLVKEKDVSTNNCVFLDAEIFRKEVRSVGQHMLLYNKNLPADGWDNFDQCLSINNFRNHDGYHDFRLKYPFATIHFLISILDSEFSIEIPVSAITPLMFTDGTYHNLFRYTENSLSWLKYLRADEPASALHKLFFREKYSISGLMMEMDKFWRIRDEISVSRERGDRVALTLRGAEGDPHNLEKRGEFFFLKDEPKQRAQKFITLLSQLTTWAYKENDWSWGHWKVFRFSKKDFSSSKTRLNNKSFASLLKKHPLSFAMTSGQNYEYTLEKPNRITD